MSPDARALLTEIEDILLRASKELDSDDEEHFLEGVQTAVEDRLEEMDAEDEENDSDE